MKPTSDQMHPLLACSYAELSPNKQHRLAFKCENDAREWLREFNWTLIKRLRKARREADYELAEYLLCFSGEQRGAQVTVHYGQSPTVSA